MKNSEFKAQLRSLLEVLDTLPDELPVECEEGYMIYPLGSVRHYLANEEGTTLEDGAEPFSIIVALDSGE